MQLSLKKAFVTPGYEAPISCALDFSQVEYVPGEFPFREPVQVQGRLFEKADMLQLELTAAYRFETVCDRCAEPVTLTGEVPVSVVLVREIAGEENDQIIAVPSETLDLGDFLRDYILLDIPTKRLCKPDCKGLCSVCGANLNRTSCSCKKQYSPFEVLKQHFEE